MINYTWTPSTLTADFSNPNNWQPVATPGANDRATVDVAGTVITGFGLVDYLLLLDAKAIEAQLTASLAIKVDGDLHLLPGSVLNTSLLNIAMSLNETGTLVVGKHSSIVINGDHPANSYAIFVGQGVGSHGKLHVEGEGAAVNGGGQPLVVGHKGHGVMLVRKGGTVTVGNADPYLYPYAVVIGNRAGSIGKIKVSDALIATHGEIVVGRSGDGTLTMTNHAIVTASTMEIGLSAGGIGAVKVKGAHARLVIASKITIGGREAVRSSLKIMHA